MTRADFTPRTRTLIEKAAGYQCSFPGCNRRTTGPGIGSTYISESGYAAHIYSASSGGPRGQGGLSIAELADSGNGIWLCGVHAKLVDNDKGSGYPPETLLSYKALHEARVQLEHEGLYSPIGWLHEFSFISGPLFLARQTVRLAKLNLIYGENGTVKTAIAEWIQGFFDPTSLERWTPSRIKPLNLKLSLLNPKLQNLGLTIKGETLQYSIDGRNTAFIPVGFNIFKPQLPDRSIKDDRRMLAQALGLPVAIIDNLLDEVNNFPHAKATNLRFEVREVEEDDEVENSDARHCILRVDVEGTYPGLPLRSLSGRESECILLELITAAARLSGKHCPTLLILDESIFVVYEGFFDDYSRHLLDPANQFQTLMCIPNRKLNLDNVMWNGWQVIRTNGEIPNISLSQEVHKKKN